MKMRKLLSTGLLVLASVFMISTNAVAYNNSQNINGKWEKLPQNSGAKGFMGYTENVPLSSILILIKRNQDEFMTYAISIPQNVINSSRVNINKEVSLTMFRVDRNDNLREKLSIPLINGGFNKSMNSYTYVTDIFYATSVSNFLKNAKGDSVRLYIEDPRYSAKLGDIKTVLIPSLIKETDR